jgi:hypothetical protein
MPTGKTQERRSAAGECRQCRAFCDKLVNPSGCLEMGCPYLYSYEDGITGQRFMGCLHKVFTAEIDLDMFILAEHAGGFGGIKMTGQPLPQCQFSVEKAYEGDGPAYECVNRTFFDCDHEGPEAIRAFDLRNSLN